MTVNRTLEEYPTRIVFGVLQPLLVALAAWSSMTRCVLALRSPLPAVFPVRPGLPMNLRHLGARGVKSVGSYQLDRQSTEVPGLPSSSLSPCFAGLEVLRAFV